MLILPNQTTTLTYFAGVREAIGTPSGCEAEDTQGFGHHQSVTRGHPQGPR